MSARPVEIVCSACGKDTLLKREPRFEGFRKVGESLTCLSCGHAYASEGEVPFKQKRGPAVFSETDRSAPVTVFEGEEKGRNCRHCANYVVNPFTQRCSLHDREVQATDVCDDFQPPQKCTMHDR